MGAKRGCPWTAGAVHGDRHIRVLERPGEVEAGELASLIRVEDLRRGVSGQRVVQRLDAEEGIHGVRQPPGENMARRPIHDRDQVQEAVLDGDRGDVGAPDPGSCPGQALIGPVDREPPEKIRANPMREMGFAGSRCLIDGLQSHQPHHPANPMTPDVNAVPPRLAGHPAAGVERVLQKQLVNAAHQYQVFRALPLRRVIERGSADRKQAASTVQARTGAVARDHRLAFAPGSSLESAGQKIPFHHQLADLGVKAANLSLMVRAGAVGAVRKHLAQTGHRLAFPGAHLVGMHLMLGCDFLDHLVAPKRLQRHAGLEYCRKSASCPSVIRWNTP